MFNGKTAVAIVAAALIIVNIGSAQTLEDHWGDFLHYTKIGRFDLAKGNAQALLNNNPDPVVLLELSQKNTRDYQILLKVNKTQFRVCI